MKRPRAKEYLDFWNNDGDRLNTINLYCDDVSAVVIADYVCAHINAFQPNASRVTVTRSGEYGAYYIDREV